MQTWAVTSVMEVGGGHGRPVTMKTGGGQINTTGGGAQSKSGEAPMVKIKDFTLASQNLGGMGGI